MWITTAKDIVCNKFNRSYHFWDEVSLLVQPESLNKTVLSTNIFDSLPTFHTSHEITVDELTCYLSTGPKDIKNEDLLKWGFECQHIYPNLSRMALNYHTIPCKSLLFGCVKMWSTLCTGSSIDVERVFSQGCILLPHVRNCLSSELMRALLCIGDWSRHVLLKDVVIKTAAVLPDLGQYEPPLSNDWDTIE